MTRTARQLCILLALLLLPTLAGAQSVWQSTPSPAASAESESWYQAREPIAFAGDTYYRAGAPRFFDQYLMVRSGSYRGIPLYVDPTLEPYSIVYVPVAGGLVQPYERRRTGDLAGTTGSRPPSLPPEVTAAANESPAVTPLGQIAQAPAPPVVGFEATTATSTQPYAQGTVGTSGPPSAVAATAPTPAVAVGTTGRTARTPVPPMRTRIGTGRPRGLNAVFVTYEGKRWLAAGPTVELSDGGFTLVGTYHGGPVYARPAEQGTIYIPSVPGLLAPYKANK